MCPCYINFNQIRQMLAKVGLPLDAFDNLQVLVPSWVSPGLWNFGCRSRLAFYLYIVDNYCSFASLGLSWASPGPLLAFLGLLLGHSWPLLGLCWAFPGPLLGLSWAFSWALEFWVSLSIKVLIIDR